VHVERRVALDLQPPAVAAPARERSVTIAWVIAGVVVLALLVALFVLLR